MANTGIASGLARPEIRNPERLFIGGRWVAASGGFIDVVSAHSEEVIQRVAAGSAADMDAAVAAARTAFDHGPWPRLTPEERIEAVTRLGRELAPRIPEIASAWIDQIGTLAAVAPMVMAGEHGWFDYYTDLASRYPFEKEIATEDGGRAFIIREPVGVVAAVTPWNNPYGIMLNKIIPALLAGCAIIMKPAPETPIEAYLIAEAAEAAGLPPGVLNLVPARLEASDHLISHRGVDKVSFTGSVGAGKHIAQVCGARLARVTLELGGKSAAIVLDDYDVESAAATLARTITISAGQVCAILSRVLVSKQRKSAFLEAVGAEMARIRVGDPYDPAADMGPLAMSRQRDRVEHYVAAGRAEGATLLLGGGRPIHLERGFYIEPTLFGDVTPDMVIAREEIFGPVLTVMTYDDEADAIAQANATDFGLYSAVFTDDAAAAHRVARGVRAGTVSQNGFRFDRNTPFGGFKDSGIGREGGEAGLLSFTETKSYLAAV